MPKFLAKIKNNPVLLMPLLPLLSFVIPILWLYFLEPSSFESMWKGRTFQLFFVWLIALELILGWESFKSKIHKIRSVRTIATIIALVLPTVYVIVSFYFGLNSAIESWATNEGIKWSNTMPLSTEYLVFTVFFGVVVFLVLGKKGLANYSIPAVFMGIVGLLYTIDNVYPYGQFTPFQFLVPTTAMFAGDVLGLMGYTTVLQMKNDMFLGVMPHLTATSATSSVEFAIAWPCAGIESLLIFTVVALLFLKRMPISWKAKAGYFAFGAAITYFINILRIVTIFLIGMQYEQTSNEVQVFHFYYGPLYSITWIISFPLIIIGTQMLWQRIKKKPLQTNNPDGLGNLNQNS
jgi:thaumarchaeosortase